MADQDKTAQVEAVAKAAISQMAALTVPQPAGSSKSGSSASSKEGRSSRNASPARLPSELVLKIKTQMSRLKTIRAISAETSAQLTQEQITSLLAQLEELHKAFQKEHAYFEVTWPEAFMDHEYFANDVHQQEAEYVMTTRLDLSQRKRLFSTNTQAHGTTQDADRTHSKLPDIKLPKFGGDYSARPSFRELFTSVIMDNSKLTSVEKLHYLRSCMQGPADQLIRSLPMTGDSLVPSWELLTARYENRRLIIQAHLDRLYDLTSVTPKNAASLTKLISTVSEANKALQSLGLTQVMWDCILVHHVSPFLDRSTREAWETSLGSAADYPRFDQLEEFLTSRARALERIEAATAHPGSSSQSQASSSKTSSKKASAHQASKASANQSNAYPCDLCKGTHFIVACSKFRDLAVDQRMAIAVKERLCYNCLGRHSARVCRSTLTCKTCQRKHHTMLHGAQQAATSLTDAAQTTPLPAPSSSK